MYVEILVLLHKAQSGNVVEWDY